MKRWMVCGMLLGAVGAGTAGCHEDEVWFKLFGAPVVAPGAAGEWDDQDIEQPCVVRRGHQFLMWYSGKGAAGHQIGLATSEDGAAWTKHAGPVLTKGPAGSFDSTGLLSPSVVFQHGLYWMWYTGQNGFKFKIGLATSADGVSWTKQGVVLSATQSWEFAGVGSPDVLWDGGLFKMWYSAAQGTPPFTRRIGYATSADGISWTRNATPVLDVGAAGEFDQEGVFGASVIRDGSIFRLWYVAIDGSAAQTIGNATSADGVVWIKNATNPVLGAGAAGEWDEGGVEECAVLRLGHRLGMLYTGESAAGVSSIGLAANP